LKVDLGLYKVKKVNIDLYTHPVYINHRKLKEGVFSISQIPIDINFFFKQLAGLIGLSIQGMEYWQCERGNKQSDLQQAQSQSSTGNELSNHCEVCSVEEACILLMAW
jgi:hypothetical protein